MREGRVPVERTHAADAAQSAFEPRPFAPVVENSPETEVPAQQYPNPLAHSFGRIKNIGGPPGRALAPEIASSAIPGQVGPPAQLQPDPAKGSPRDSEAEESLDEELDTHARPRSGFKPKMSLSEYLQHRRTGRWPGATGQTTQRRTIGASGENGTGIPTPVRTESGQFLENNQSGRGGHYNSARMPALSQRAWTRGQAVDVAREHERRVAHEGWHTVQAMQGRVRPTMKTDGVEINDDGALEREVDVMGKRSSRNSRDGFLSPGPARDFVGPDTDTRQTRRRDSTVREGPVRVDRTPAADAAQSAFGARPFAPVVENSSGTEVPAQQYPNPLAHSFGKMGNVGGVSRSARTPETAGWRISMNLAPAAQLQLNGQVNPVYQAAGASLNHDAPVEREVHVIGAEDALASPDVLAQGPRNNILAPGVAPAQRKLVVGNRPHVPDLNENEALKAAANDQFVRDYKSEKQMKDHLVSKDPVCVGLIESRALWYSLPYLPDQFFVFGESHAGVKGGDIKQASNIKKPILDEKHPGWNVGQAASTGPVTTDQGLDENSSKLLRALELWNPKRPTTAVPQPIAGEPAPRQEPALPDIPKGEESVRETEHGSYRLVIRGQSGASELWKPVGATAAPENTYSTEDQVYKAISNLFPRVFESELASRNFKRYGQDFQTAWTYFNELYDKDLKFFDKQTDQFVTNWTTIASNVRHKLLLGVEKKVKENYDKLYKADPVNAFKQGQLHEKPQNLKKADDYRNEFILAAVFEGESKGFAFATMGDNHVAALKDRFDNRGVKYITVEDFYTKFSNVAVELPSATLDEEISTFLAAVDRTGVLPHEDSILGLLDKLNKKGYPSDSNLRIQLLQLLDRVRTSRPPAPSSFVAPDPTLHL